ncbi:MAG: hypothetical protein C0407_13790 [Desulfobacca sp.]|nr:hypothetical protein [Desulfobacca sp.]
MQAISIYFHGFKIIGLPANFSCTPEFNIPCFEGRYPRGKICIPARNSTEPTENQIDKLNFIFS